MAILQGEERTRDGEYLIVVRTSGQEVGNILFVRVDALNGSDDSVQTNVTVAEVQFPWGRIQHGPLTARSRGFSITAGPYQKGQLRVLVTNTATHKSQVVPVPLSEMR